MLLLTLIFAFAGAQTAWAEDAYNISYIDANGNPATCIRAEVVTTSMEGISSNLDDKGHFNCDNDWLVVTGDVTLNGAKCTNLYDKKLILCDGATLTISERMWFTNTSLTIYGQSGGTGKLVVSGSYANSDALHLPSGKTLTINGGIVEVTNTATQSGCHGLSVGTLVMNGGTATFSGGSSSWGSVGIDGNVTFNGGNLTATGKDGGIRGNTTISWKNSTDRIKAKLYEGSVTIAEGKGLKDPSGNIYIGTLTSAQKSTIANVMLQPPTQAEFIDYLNANYYTLTLPDGVTASGEHLMYNDVDYYVPGSTVTLSSLPTASADYHYSYTVNGTPISGTSFAITANATVALILTIDSAAGWGEFCDLLEGNDKGFFSGKTVKLANNITVSRMAGSEGHEFTGTFDGNQKTLTFNYTTSAENAAPFQYVENATIQNLRVAGTIQTSNKFAAGFIAHQYGTVTIQNCRSSVVINSSINGDGTHGGFVAENQKNASLTIDGCVFDGKLLTTNGTTKCGGFVGWKNKNGTVTVTNSRYAPAALGNDETECASGSATFVRNGSAGDNCYYTRTLGTAQGTWDGEPDFVKRGDGAGTSANPYKITNANDLKDLAVYVNGTGTYSHGFTVDVAHDCSGVYFQQTNPITLSGNWTPIGTSSKPFKGKYDGDNKTISGLTVSGSYQYAGLFGYTKGTSNYNVCSLKNIIVKDCNIDVSGTTESYAGGIVGYASDDTQIRNCRVSGTVKAKTNAGGIVGILWTTPGGHIAQMIECFADVTVATATYKGKLIGRGSTTIEAYANSVFNSKTSYYHADGSGVTAIGEGDDVTYSVPLYTISGVPSGMTMATTNATLTHGDTPYFASGATTTLTVDDADKSITALTATGAASSEVATNKKSATITLASSDVTVSATLQTVSGTTSDGLTWSLTQDGSGNYTVLTISGTGAMNNYDHTTVGGLWRTTAPWGYGLTSVTIGNGVTSIGNFAFIGCQSLATVTIGNSVATIGENAFDHCDAMTSVTLPASVTSIGANAFKNCVGLQRIDIQHDGAVSLASNVFQNDNALQYIVFPSIAAEQANTTGNWSGFASKRRAKFGNQHFGVTTEGGTAAYKIATADDLRNLAAAVSAGNSGSGKTFRQTTDIDLSSGGNFTPIGTGGSKYFSGTYDGGGKNISGLTVNGSYKTAGLFGCVSSGTVRNVVLVSPTVSNTSTALSTIFVGTIAGDCSHATIENCHVINPTVSAPGNVYSTKSIGALIGYLDELFSITSITNNYVTNCYYYGGNQSNAIGHTDANSTVTRVSAAHLVNLGNNVTIQTAMADELGFTCDSDGDDVVENYWRQGAELTLGNTLGEAPEYYALNYATTAGTINGSTLTVGNADATVSAAIRSDGQPHSITYMKADGTTDQADAIALDSYETVKEYGNYVVHLAAGTYYVGHDISYDYKIVADGDITLILGNGKTMTLASNVTGIQGGTIDLTIYGQSLDPATAGTLRYDGTSNLGIYVGDYTQHSGNVSLICSDYNGVKALEASTVTLNGGKLTITANSTNAKAIRASMTVTVTGGQLDATATGTNAVGILASYGDITLGWTNASDYIHVTSYSANGTVKIADGQSLYNGSEVLSGTITDMSKLDGKTLRPYKTITLADAADNSSTIREWNGSVAEVTLQGRTLTKDGNWNTLCLPFAVNSFAGTPLEGATVKELDATLSSLAGNTLTLKFKDATSIEAGKPYIIKWTTTGDNIVNPVFSNVTISSTTPTAVESYDHTVTFVGQYSPFSIVESGATGDNEGNKNEILLMTTGNKIGYSKNPRTLNCFRCHFYVPTSSGEFTARNIEVDFGEGEATSVASMEDGRSKMEDVYYTLDGRKLEGKPTAKGMYIVNGRKVIIK